MTLYLSNRDGNGKTSEEGHYKFQTSTYSGNVLGTSAFQVTQNSPVARSVIVLPGQFRIETSNNYSYTGWSSSNEVVAISTADPANARITSIVLYIDKGASTSPSPPNNPGVPKLIAVNGTPAAVPTPPNGTTIQSAVGSGNPYVVLANVTLAAAGTTVVTANISDQRTQVTVGNTLVATASIIDSAITTAKIDNLAVTNAKIANSTIQSSKLDFSTGIWWEELGRNTITSGSSTGLSVTFPARKYLRVIVRQASASGGTLSGRLRFNNDTGPNYNFKYSVDNAAYLTSASDPAGYVLSSTVAESLFAMADIYNQANAEKVITSTAIGNATSGAANYPRSIFAIGKWANTTAQITTVALFNASGTGVFGPNTEIVVLGHN